MRDRVFTRSLLVALVTLGSGGAALAQQRPSPAALVDRAFAALDSAQVERADSLARGALAGMTDADRPLRARALQLLAARRWWMDDRDSALALLRAGVVADPFASGDTMRWNPELMAAYRTARRGAAVLGVRVAGDTTIAPDSGSLPMVVAVGQPALVRARLVRPAGDSILASIQVDSFGMLLLPLRRSADAALEPGSYRVAIDVVGSGATAAPSVVSLDIARVRVDTSLHQVPLSPVDFRPERRRGAMSGGSLLRGLALGAAAVVLPIALANADVGSDDMRTGALAAGVSIGLASVLGAVAGRPMTVIDENVRYNRDRRESWRAQEAAVTAANDHLRRFAPLHVRATVSSGP